MKFVAGALGVCLSLLPLQAAELRARFIGNEAFEITDGKVTLLSDFPYRSGYSIYMTYAEEEIHLRENSICLITHRHGDHFEPELAPKIGCRVVAAPEIANKLDNAEAVRDGVEVQTHDVTIEAIGTPHADLEHFSYLVTWHGLRLYFVGDTETPEHIRDNLDVLFVSPWLLRTMERSGIDPPAKKIVVYHHAANEKVDCKRCIVPEQGARLTLP